MGPGGRYVDPSLAADALTAPENPLTARELDVLRLAAYDLPASVIAGRAQLSNGTVSNYLAPMLNKPSSAVSPPRCSTASS